MKWQRAGGTDSNPPNIYEWADNPHAETIFWLNGIAGTGKSTLSRTVARTFSERSQLGATFFFKRGEGDRDNVAKFFTTVAKQLILNEPAIAVHVKHAIHSDPAVVGKAIREQFEKLILKPLSEISKDGSKSSTLIIVVDALDECEQDEDAKLIIDFFSRTRSLKSLSLRVFVTSRFELPIRLGFRAIKDTYQNLVLHEIPTAVAEHDISVYLWSELERIRDEYNSSVSEDKQLPTDWPSQSKIQILVDMAVPNFVFAATVCRFLADRKCGNPDKQLTTIMAHQQRSQESTLDATYLLLLDQVLVSFSAQEKYKALEQFQVIVGSIVVLATPLSTTSLARILGIHREEVDSQVDLLHPVLSVPTSPRSPVKLLHPSFRDFLLNPEKRETNPFWVNEMQMHRKMATNCLRLMKEHLRTDICRLQAPGILRSAIDPDIIDDKLPADIQYACLHWVYHLERGKYGLRDVDQVHDFLGRHFLHWLEAVSMTGRASESVALINTLQSLLEPEDSAELSRFHHDAMRFVLANNFIIDSAPLQLYSSVLAFTPLKSIVRETYKSEISDWISLLPEVDAHWNLCLQTIEGHSHSVNSVSHRLRTTGQFGHGAPTRGSASRNSRATAAEIVLSQACRFDEYVLDYCKPASKGLWTDNLLKILRKCSGLDPI